MGPSLDERNCNTHPCPGQTCCQTVVHFHFLLFISTYSIYFLIKDSLTGAKIVVLQNKLTWLLAYNTL